MPHLALSFTLALALAACAAPPGPPAAPTVAPGQSVIYHNGMILTMEADQPNVEAIALRGAKIEALGSDAAILALAQADTRVIDLEGRTLMPGFVDAHTHILNDARGAGRSLDQAQALALSNGITTLGDLYVDEPFLREMRAFDQRAALRVRTSLYLVANTNCGQPQGNWWKRYPPTRVAGEMLRIGGVKIFTDGGSCGGVALSFELVPGEGQGDLWLTQDELNRLVAEAQAGGYQAAIHAIGDRAVAQAQAAIALALDGGPNIYRHRMEHLSVLRPEFVPRFGELGIVPVLNGEYPACTPFGPPVPDAYRPWEWPWRDLRDANPDLPIAWHSDYPFLSINPLMHLYGFVTRNDAYQAYTCPAPEALRDDTLTAAEALSIMTIESAYALFREAEVGSLAVGKYADVIVLSDNPLTVPAEDLKRLKVLSTMVGGRFEYCDARELALCPGYQARTPLPLPDLRPPVPARWLTLLLMGALPLTVAVGVRRRRTARALTLLCGAAGVLGGGLWAWIWGWANQFTTTDTDALLGWLLVAAGTLLALAVMGLAGRARASRLGGLGAALAGVGVLLVPGSLILTEWFQQPDAWYLLLVGILSHAVGLVVFGLAHRRLALGRAALGLGLVGGVLPLAMALVIGESNWPAVIMGFGLGLGWVLVGVLLLRSSVAERRQAAYGPQGAAVSQEATRP